MKIFLFFVSLLFLAGCASHSIKISDSPPQIVYHVDVSNYTDDFFHVTVSTNDLTAKNNIYNFTATAPGTYQVMDFGRFVESFKAFDENGKELKTERLSTNRWQIENSEELAKVVYKIEDSFDADIDSNFIAPMSGTGIQEDFIVCNTFGVLGYFEGLQSNPVKLKISYNPEWTIGTALDKDANGYYFAETYDRLADSPILLGELTEANTKVNDIDVGVFVYTLDTTLYANKVLSVADEVLQSAGDFIGSSPVQNEEVQNKK